MAECRRVPSDQGEAITQFLRWYRIARSPPWLVDRTVQGTSASALSGREERTGTGLKAKRTHPAKTVQPTVPAGLAVSARIARISRITSGVA